MLGFTLNSFFVQISCTVLDNTVQYVQQHPARLCKQLYPQTAGLLFSALPKTITPLSVYLQRGGKLS